MTEATLFVSLCPTPRAPAPRVAPQAQAVPFVRTYINLAGHPTSISLEPHYLRHVRRIAAERGETFRAFVNAVHKTSRGNLARALRLAVLADLERRCGLDAELAS